VNERETLVAAIGGLHPRHLDAALASPDIARRSIRLSSWLRSVKLAPAIRTDRVDHDFARGRRHKHDIASLEFQVEARFLGKAIFRFLAPAASSNFPPPLGVFDFGVEADTIYGSAGTPAAFSSPSR
jgi:hypothetical protein